MIVFDNVTKELITKEEIRTIVEQKGEWEGFSEEFRMSWATYYIKKRESSYSASTASGVFVATMDDISSFDVAFASLLPLQSASSSISYCSYKPTSVDPSKIFDRLTRTIVTFENIRTILINKNYWSGYCEWSDSDISEIIMIRREHGFDITVIFKDMQLEAHNLRKMNDVLLMLAKYNEIIEKMLK